MKGNTEPMVIRQCGTVVQAGKGRFRRVRWEDGQFERFDDVPELSALSKGDRFEAMVTRTAWKDQYDRGWKFISMSDVKLLGPPPTHEECKALWDRIMAREIQTIADLPETTWD